MRNPYKKFQNSSIHGSEVMLYIKKRDEQTDRRADGRTDGRTNNPEAICYRLGYCHLHMNVRPQFLYVRYFYIEILAMDKVVYLQFEP